MAFNLSKLHDAAFACARKNSGLTKRGTRLETRAELRKRFPDASPTQIIRAYVLAEGLLKACYDVGDACRNMALTHAEAEAVLEEKFPGFSPALYQEVVSYGMYISR